MRSKLPAKPLPAMEACLLAVFDRFGAGKADRSALGLDLQVGLSDAGQFGEDDDVIALAKNIERRKSAAAADTGFSQLLARNASRACWNWRKVPKASGNTWPWFILRGVGIGGSLPFDFWMTTRSPGSEYVIDLNQLCVPDFNTRPWPNSSQRRTDTESYGCGRKQ